jgi:hypothetical protein
MEYWTVIGTIAQVISLGALVTVVRELKLRRRRMRSVHWGVNIVGSVGPTGGPFRHVLELTNAGVGTAALGTVVFVNSRYVESPEYRFRRVIGPGAIVQMQVESAAIKDAWVKLLWHDQDDASLVCAEWFPLTGGPLSSAWAESNERTPKAQWWRHRPPESVGPDHAVRSSFRAGTNSARRSRNIRKLISGLPEGHHHAWHASAPREVTDLPVS